MIMLVCQISIVSNIIYYAIIFTYFLLIMIIKSNLDPKNAVFLKIIEFLHYLLMLYVS